MGKPIVYCQGCGKSLREEEFHRGQAQVVENRPYCTACKPLEAVAPLPPPSKRNIPAAVIRPGSSTRMSTAPPRRDSRTALVVGGGLASAALLLLVIVLLSGRSSTPEPSRPEAEPPRAAERKAAPAEPEALLALERLAASSTDAEDLLARCRNVRQAPGGARWEARIRQVEERAIEMRMAQERKTAQQIDPFLVQIRKVIEEDPNCIRRAEVEGMLDAARKIAGTRGNEVDQARAEYRKRCADVPRRAAEEAQAEARQLAARKSPAEAVARLDRHLAEFPGSPFAPAVEKLRGEIEAGMKSEAALARAASDGTLLLTAEGATRAGSNLILKGTTDRYLGNWHKVADSASWTVEAPRAGTYRLELSYACNKGAGGEFAVVVNAAELRKTVEATGDWKTYATVPLGSIELPGGRFVLTVRPRSITGDGLMNLKTLKLIPER